MTPVKPDKMQTAGRHVSQLDDELGSMTSSRKRKADNQQIDTAQHKKQTYEADHTSGLVRYAKARVRESLARLVSASRPGPDAATGTARKLDAQTSIPLSNEVRTACSGQPDHEQRAFVILLAEHISNVEFDVDSRLRDFSTEMYAAQTTFLRDIPSIKLSIPETNEPAADGQATRAAELEKISMPWYDQHAAGINAAFAQLDRLSKSLADAQSKVQQLERASEEDRIRIDRLEAKLLLR